VENKKIVHLPRWKSTQFGLPRGEILKQCKIKKIKKSNFVLLFLPLRKVSLISRPGGISYAKKKSGEI